MHHDSMLIKRSTLMQKYADIYLPHSHSTFFGYMMGAVTPETCRVTVQ